MRQYRTCGFPASVEGADEGVRDGGWNAVPISNYRRLEGAGARDAKKKFGERCEHKEDEVVDTCNHYADTGRGRGDLIERFRMMKANLSAAGQPPHPPFRDPSSALDCPA